MAQSPAQDAKLVAATILDTEQGSGNAIQHLEHPAGVFSLAQPLRPA
jgi:hypothetical protein